MVSDQLLAALRQSHEQMFQAQREITTGLSREKPSDDPSQSAAIMAVLDVLGRREQYDRNLQHAISSLNLVDDALGTASEILREAQGIASSQIGVGSDAETREAQALVIDSQIQALIDLANRQHQGISLFGGNNGAAPQGQVFVEFLGGIRYVGADQNLQSDVGSVRTQTFNSNGLDAFGALSSRVQSSVDLDPQATAATRIGEVEGAQGLGVRTGSVEISVDGTTATVDLSGVDTLGDVVTLINDAIDTLDPTAGSLAVVTTGFELTANAGHTVTVADLGGGQTAADLGIELSSTGGVADTGPDINRLLTETTALADLGAVVDFASGLFITQGAETATADFSAATTIQDLQNVISELNLGLRLVINADGDALDIVSEVSGLRLSVGENGGTTAEDLGLTTLGTATELADFRDGLGIETASGDDDFAVTVHDGTTFNVDATGLTTVDELVTAIETAATGAGLTIGVDFDVELASVGTGITFTDNTVGADDFRIENLGISQAATQLGITGNAGAAATFTSTDNATVRVESVFTHLMSLRESLSGDDTLGITLAGQNIEQDTDSVVRARANVGVQARRVEQQQQRSADLKLAEQTMLSDLRDADLTEVITRFAQLQQQIAATMAIGAQNLQLSFLDFLR